LVRAHDDQKQQDQEAHDLGKVLHKRPVERHYGTGSQLGAQSLGWTERNGKRQPKGAQVVVIRGADALSDKAQEDGLNEPRNLKNPSRRLLG